MADIQRSLIVSRTLALTAIALWLLSLSQPALIIENGTGKPRIMVGLEVLGEGWLGGILLFTFGWYANLPFFIAAISLLRSPKLPWKAATFGLLLALDTFRLQGLPGGGRADIYGYGLGVVFWFAAFGILLLAVAWRNTEQRGCGTVRLALRTPAVLATLAALGCVTTLYGILAYRTTQHTSITEAEFLPAGSIKNGAVCTEAVLAPATRITLDAPLEVKGRAYPLDSPVTLLGWGIPLVRKGGYDFALSDPRDINSIYWKPAAGPAAAKLSLSAKNSGDVIEATLTSSDDNIKSFQQIWKRDIRKTSLYCPDYRPYDSATSSPPRSLLTAGVDVPGGLIPPTVIAVQSAITVAPYRLEDLPRASTHGVRTEASAAEPEPNAGCPPQVRFVDHDLGAIELGTYGGQQTLAIGERRYFLTNNQPLAAVCSGDSVYLYYFWLDNARKPYLLYIQRRQLNDFRKVWSLVTGFDYARPHPFEGKRNVKIRSLHDDAGRIAIEIADVDLSLNVDISFPAPVK